MIPNKRVLVIGATGFVGTHVVPVLAARGFDVVCGSRHPERAAAKHPDRTWVHADLDDAQSLADALEGADAAVYLAHGMTDTASYAIAERREAETFRDVAAETGLRRIVYLGGMRPKGRASKHLASRIVTGEILRAGTVPTVELRATMIIGGGSESFRIVRDLAARLPWMLLPKWLDSVSEPVAISDIAEAIACALALDTDESCVYGAPGLETLSGRDILMRTARMLGQKPVAWRVPVVTPKLSSYWIRLITRANPRLATELVEGLRSDIVSEGRVIWSEMPEHRRLSFDEAAKLALREEAKSIGPSSRLIERALHRLASA